MLYTAAFGLFSNLVMMKVLHGGHGHSHGGHSHGGDGGHSHEKKGGHSHGGHSHDKTKKGHGHSHDKKDEKECGDHKENVINHTIKDSELEKKNMKKSKNLSMISEADNPNMRAAMIHLIGDLV